MGDNADEVLDRDRGTGRDLRARAAWVLTILLLLAKSPGHASEFYEWTDENGVTHYADSLEQVPAKYRDRVKPPDLDGTPKAPAGQGKAAGTRPAAQKPATPTEKPASVAAVSEGSSLKRFEVPYEPLEGSTRRVIIQVTFNDSMTAPMALDTGSPGMILSIELAERLGLFSRDQGTLLVAASGIGGSVFAVRTIVDAISVGGVRDVFVPTTVTPQVSARFQGLIGMDFLSNYTVSIDSRKNVVVFQENAPDQDARGGHPEEWWRRNFKEFREERDFWRERASTIDGNTSPDSRAFADFQARQSERLLQRLDQYASDNGVPRHWR